jgi:biopolymer transport protein ExbD
VVSGFEIPYHTKTWILGLVMRRAFGMKKTQGKDEGPNLTPMLDVVFIMLIFFIVTATFVKEVGLDVNQPDEDKPKTIDPNKKSIVVRITNRDRIIIGKRDVDRRSVRANIERLHAENPEAPVIIQAHPESTTDVMIHIMDSARQAGVYNVSLAAQ